MPTRESIMAALVDRVRIDEGWSPGEAELADAPIIEDWMIERGEGRLEGVSWLFGVVTGHPHIEDGLMSTSGLVVMSEKEGWARTASRWYRLGRRLNPRLPE